MPANIAAQGGEGQLKMFEVYSNYGVVDVLDYLTGIIEVNYYESILDDTVRATATFADTGYRKSKEDAVGVFEKDDINMTSGEKVHLILEDGYGEELKLTDDKQLRINGDPGLTVESVNKVIFSVDTYSKESIDNMKADYWVYGRYDGEIPLNVDTILKETLKTPKKVILDRGLNSYNFLGHAEKPFYLITTLAKKCVPADIPNSFGILAGYLFYETYDGFNFRSIDKLFMQKPKKNFIYNEIIGTVPPGYDAHILDYSFVGSLNLDNLSKTGAMTQARKQEFNRMKSIYGENTFDSLEQYKDPSIHGGIERPLLAEKLEGGPLQDFVTRHFNSLMSDDGILPRGFTLAEQIPRSQNPNFNMEEILRQSAMRYNQLFSHKMSIAIPGDFSLRAGDLVFVDFPEISGKKNRVVSQKISGIYMIADVCHRLTKSSCYTGLNLVRDSIYRKPFK